MTRLFLLLLLALSASALSAQTIIELKPGGTVRAKDLDDYKADDPKPVERLREDSLTYVDNLRRGFNALHSDSLREARRLFTEALRLRPTAPGNHIIYYNLALLDIAEGKVREAAESLTEILNHTPDYYDARLARAQANLRLKRSREAIEDARTLIDRSRASDVPQDIVDQARFVRAAARYEARLYPEARTDLESILRDQPENLNALVLHSLTLYRMGQPKEALNRLNLIVSAHPDDVDALATRAEVEAELEMNAPARADYDALIRLEPNEPSHHIGRARMLIRLDEKAAARRDLDKAVALGTPRGVVQALYNLTR